MKRGKRQIIEKTNIFQSQQQSPTNFQPTPQSPIPDTWTGIAQHSQKYQTKPKVESPPQPTKIKPYENNHHNQKVEAESTLNTTSSPAEDERKKRLQMLRQKYLKTGAANAAKEQQPKPNPIKKQEKAAELVENLEKAQKQNNENSQNVTYQFANTFSNSTKWEVNFGSREIQENKLQNETPISKPSQFDQHRKSPPSVPEPKRKRAPPPRYIPPPQPEIKEQNVQQKQEASPEPAQHDFNPFQQQKQQKKEDNVSNNKKPKGIPVVSNYQNEHVEKQTDNLNNLAELIRKWVNNEVNNLKGSNPNHLLKKISQQIVPGSGQHAQQIFLSFLLSNAAQYSKSQSSVIMNIIRDSHQLSPLATIVLSIKCGSSALELFCTQIIRNNFSPLLHQLIQLKSHLLQSQLNSFVKFYLANGECSQQTLSLLVQLDPTCPTLYQYMNNIQFCSLTTAAKILMNMRNHITEPMCPFYFKLINLVIVNVQDASILENAVKLVNGINFQSAYQLKKDTKLKIIEIIDRITNGVSQQNMPRPPVKQVQISKNQKEAEKGSGINFMGYFNQAIKKITSQIPQKPSEPTNNTEQAKQTIEWDPVMKRYRINGKVPEDEYGKVEIPVNEEGQDKPKKKAPPPPPPRVSSKAQPKQPAQTVSEPPVMQSQSQQQSQLNPQMGNYDQEEKIGIPVPPRAGLKGINSKKPRVQVRYT